MADDEEDKTVHTPWARSGASASSDELSRDRIRHLTDERYDGLGTIAEGGMGIVERIGDRLLERELARKILHTMWAKPGDAENLVQEARITARLAHPHIVPVHDLGVTSDGVIYFTMKCVEGETLGSIAREKSAEEVPDWYDLLDLVDIVIKVCDALSFAHDRGVLHCDLKPDNVMVGEFGEVYLMDWGIARLIEDESQRPDAEDTDFIIGTPAYMPPEQAFGRPLDARADIFALGAVLWELLVGRPPIRAKTTVAAIVEARRAATPDPGEVREGVPPALNQIVRKAMAADREERYASAAEMKNDLRSFVRGGDAFELVTYPAGTVIVAEGDRGDAAYIIETGECHVTIGGRRIGKIGPGEVFGEMAVIGDSPRNATVTAAEDVEARRISGEALLDELDSMKPWMAALVRTLTQRLRDVERQT